MICNFARIRDIQMSFLLNPTEQTKLEVSMGDSCFYKVSDVLYQTTKQK